LDPQINESVISLLPNCFIDKRFVDDSYIFESNSILLSDVYSDDIRPDDILSNLEVQLKWAYKVRFYMLKFMLPWNPGDLDPLRCRFDKRVLIPKAKYNSSEMRLWGCFDSSTQVLDFKRMDRTIAYFNRYKRFSGDTCFDCWRIGRFFQKSRLIIPSIVFVFFEDRGYEIWRFHSMFRDYKDFYKEYGYNEVCDSDFTVSSVKYECCYPLRICNYYLNCGWCSNLMETLFDEKDFQWLGIYLDMERCNVFNSDDLILIRSRSDFEFVNDMLMEKYSSQILSLRSCLATIKEDDMLDWNESSALNEDGDPIELLDLK